MLEQIITITSSDYLKIIAQDINSVLAFLASYWDGANTLRVASIVLMLIAVALFLLLIISLYVKSIIAFFKSESKKNADTEEDGFEYTEYTDEEENNEEEVTEQNEERELERELANELNLSKEDNSFVFDDGAEKTDLKVLPQENENQKEEKSAEKENKETKNNMIDLDWKKGKIIDLADDNSKLDPALLKYQQTKKSLNDLVALIIDMIGRGVDELKIAQTIMFRNQGENSEDDILQTITAIKDFIALAVSGKFKKAKQTKQLPDEDEALYHLAMGDASLALALMEAVMDENIEIASTMPVGERRDKIFMETSYYSSTFGSLAALSDVSLATGSFELAVELAPQNLIAWGRLADMYHILENNQKAIWAYNKVLDMADEELSPQLVANARKILSQYYYAQGNSLQAAKFFTLSKQYYDSIGINRRLDKKEIEIIELIESRQKEDLEGTIAKILANYDARQLSFA